MGEVYRARDERLKRDVALKLLHANNGNDAYRQQKLLQEAQAVGSLNHPNIVVVHDVGTAAGVPYIVSELIEGRSLRAVIQQGNLLMRDIIQLAAQIADGLASAHDAGLAHRDLKPENVMVTRDGRAKILDFGLALAFGSSPLGTDSTDTSAGLVQGTVPYMSPEQARGGQVDFRSDQFAFGALLYEMIAGRPPFSRETPVQTLNAIIEDEPEPLDRANPKTPVFLRWIVERCLEKDPIRRYAATGDLARDLATLRDRSGEAGLFGAQVTAPRRGRWRIAAGIVAAGLAAAGVIAFGGSPGLDPIQWTG